MSLITPQEAKKISFDKHSGYSPLRDDSDYIIPIIHYLIQHEASCLREYQCLKFGL